MSLFLGSSGVSLIVTVAQCWSRLGVTAEWSHHSAPESCTVQLDVVLISHLLQPNLATKTVPLAGEQQVMAPLPPLLGSPAIFMVSPSCHRSLMPSAPSSWTPTDSTNLHLLRPGLISGLRPKDKAFNGVKKLVLTQWNPAVMSQCWCQPEDRSLCDTTHTWSAQPPVTWVSSAWALHLQFQSGGLNRVGQSNVPLALLSACSSRDATQGDVLTKGRNKGAFPVVFPMQSLGVSWSPSPSLLMC